MGLFQRPAGPGAPPRPGTRRDVGILYRDEQYNPDTAEPGVAEISIAKQRNGPMGTVRVMFDKAFARFRNFSPREEGAGAGYGGGYE